MLKIDMHTHIIPKTLPDWAKKFGYGDFIFLEERDDGKADMIQGGKYSRTAVEYCWEEDVRTKEYESSNTQVQVACRIPVSFPCWAKHNDGLEASSSSKD